MNTLENTRLFIAVDLPFELKQKIDDLQKEIDLEGLKKVNIDNLHITLCFMGEVETKEKHRIMEEFLSFKFESFNLVFGGVSAFPDEEKPRVIYLKIEGNLKELSDRIHKHLNIEIKREFVPHLTLARVKSVSDVVKIKNFFDKNKSTKLGSFNVKEIFLYSSKLMREGLEYKKLGEINAIDSL